MRYVTLFALTFSSLVFLAGVVIVCDTVREHSPVMLDVAREASSEARYLFLRECTRKNTLKACEAAK